jgi:hypothetical protein
MLGLDSDCDDPQMLFASIRAVFAKVATLMPANDCAFPSDVKLWAIPKVNDVLIYI